MEAGWLRPEDEAEYGRFVGAHPDACIYHTLQWRDVLAESYGFKARYWTIRKEGRLAGVFPAFEVKTVFGGRRLVSLPFSHRVPLLAEDAEATEALLGSAAQYARREGCRYMEIRSGTGMAESSGFMVRQDHLMTTLELNGDAESLWRRLDGGSVRWGIRRAIRRGVEVLPRDGLEDYRVFYELEARTRKAQGAPLYPFAFFRLLWERLSAAGMARLYLAYADKVPVAGLILLEYKARAIYGYAASNRERSSLRNQPNQLLVWTAIQAACARGHRLFDFGSSPVARPGLLAFKERWGGRTEGLRYHYLAKGDRVPVPKRDSRRVRCVESVLKRLPMPIFKKAGPLLLREAV